MASSKSSPASLILQERDIALLRGLFESRVMTSPHIAALYFGGKEEYTKKRIQQLKAARLIAERPNRKPSELAVLCLTRSGLAPLHERGILQEYPAFDLPALERRAQVSEITLKHELEVMDVKASFVIAIAAASGFALKEFSTWPLLNQFEVPRSGFDSSPVLVKPDGFIRVEEAEQDGGASEHSFFIELDRSTETQDTLAAKASYYLDYYRSGGFAERNGATRDAFKDYPFRVLIILKNAERRNNAAERLLQHKPPILSFVWLTTFDEVKVDPLGAIWVRPADYRDALAGTPFAAGSSNASEYRRSGAREKHVEAHVAKQRPLASD